MARKSDQPNWRNREPPSTASNQNAPKPPLSPRFRIVSFFYSNSNRRRQIRQATIIPQEDTRYTGAIESRSGTQEDQRRISVKSLYKVFQEFRDRGTRNMKAFKLAHPTYGLACLVVAAAFGECEHQVYDEHVAILSSIDAFGRFLENHETNSANQGRHVIYPREEAAEIAINHNFHMLERRYADEAAAAIEDLPKMGIVTVVAEFEKYLYDMIEEAFDEVYVRIISVQRFQEIWPDQACSLDDEVEDNGLSPPGNIFKIWLSARSNLSEEFTIALKACDEMKKYEDLKNVIPKRWLTTLYQRDIPQHKVDVMYECMKNHPIAFSQWVIEIASAHKKMSLVATQTQPTLDSIAKSIGRLLEHDQQKAKRAEKIFKAILNEMVAYKDKHSEMRLEFEGVSDGKKYSFRLTNDNILATIGDQLDRNSIWSLRLEIRNSLYDYVLTDEDKTDICNFYKNYNGWLIWIRGEGRYMVHPSDAEAFEQLMRLHYGIRSLISTSNSNKGANIVDLLSDTPISLNLVAVKELSCEDDEGKCQFKMLPYRLLQNEEARAVASKCEQYLLSLWKDALDGKLEIDYYLYFSMMKFYDYAAYIVGQTVTCCVWKLTREFDYQGPIFGLNAVDLNHITAEFFGDDTHDD